ncbi:MAG: hypothetical protein JEZ04_10210 [Spirochaetales bacterium]|nr:hypothetical protein [Spirochaetales bacterium]
MFKPIFTRVLTISLILLSAASVFSEELSLGRTDSWSSIAVLENTMILKKDGGRARIVLSDNEYLTSSSTEMLLHFNNDLLDSSGNYTLRRNTGVTISAADKKMGGGAAVFFGDGEILELIPDENASFAAGGSLSDFTIEFWLNPARLSEGETILRWQAAVDSPNDLLQQEILCAVSGRNLFWQFSNFFLTPELDRTKFILTSGRSLIPKRWHHHMLRYERKTGLLEYIIDGIPEAMTYISRDGRESAEIFSPVLGTAKPSSFMIGQGFIGYLDELRISNSVITEPVLNQYRMNSGIASTEIIDLDYFDSRLLDINSREELPGETRINYFYRISNNYFNPQAQAPSWKQILPGEKLPPGIKGRYLQIMAELFPDGTGKNTPGLIGLNISFNKNLPPLPPSFITGAAGNESAVIRWKPVNDSDIGGYRVYYGDSPGFYFGTGSSNGSSPLDAGKTDNLKIQGLENGKLYYFAVSSYDDAEIPQESIFSTEISVRPSAISRNN